MIRSGVMTVAVIGGEVVWYELIVAGRGIRSRSGSLPMPHRTLLWFGRSARGWCGGRWHPDQQRRRCGSPAHRIPFRSGWRRRGCWSSDSVRLVWINCRRSGGHPCPPLCHLGHCHFRIPGRQDRHPAAWQNRRQRPQCSHPPR